MQELEHGWSLSETSENLELAVLGTALCKVHVFFMSDSFSLGSHSVHFTKGYCPHSFHAISTKLYRKYGNRGWGGTVKRVLLFLAI